MKWNWCMVSVGIICLLTLLRGGYYIIVLDGSRLLDKLFATPAVSTIEYCEVSSYVVPQVDPPNHAFDVSHGFRPLAQVLPQYAFSRMLNRRPLLVITEHSGHLSPEVDVYVWLHSGDEPEVVRLQFAGFQVVHKKPEPQPVRLAAR